MTNRKPTIDQPNTKQTPTNDQAITIKTQTKHQQKTKLNTEPLNHQSNFEETAHCVIVY